MATFLTIVQFISSFDFLFYFLVFVLGSVVGSFLNCVIYRLETRESFLKGRSCCPHCKHILSWKDLIPIFSFLILKGKCRYCKKKISLQYPLVELFTAILFLLPVYITLYSSVDLIFYWIISSFLIIIFVFDLKHYLIPDKIIYPAIVIAFLNQILTSNIEHLTSNLILGILPSLFFLAIILISHETWMGFGDFKLSILMGLILGWPKILVALFFAFFIGAVVGLILISLKRKKMKSQIPFAPFLISGTFLTIFFGEEIIDWYLKLILLK
jgi:prepilin signal peptidase PulO-like enzyme (type II secretory pathway)